MITLRRLLAYLKLLFLHHNQTTTKNWTETCKHRAEQLEWQFRQLTRPIRNGPSVELRMLTFVQICIYLKMASTICFVIWLSFWAPGQTLIAFFVCTLLNFVFLYLFYVSKKLSEMSWWLKFDKINQKPLVNILSLIYQSRNCTISRYGWAAVAHRALGGELRRVYLSRPAKLGTTSVHVCGQFTKQEPLSLVGADPILCSTLFPHTKKRRQC